MNTSEAHGRAGEQTRDDDQLLTYGEAARLLGVSQRWLWARVASGEIAAVRMPPRVVRFRRSTLLAWVERHERAGAAE